MADDVFQKHVTALAVKRLEKPKKMSTQNAKYWSEIVNQLYNFDRGLCFLFVANNECNTFTMKLFGQYT